MNKSILAEKLLLLGFSYSGNSSVLYMNKTFDAVYTMTVDTTNNKVHVGVAAPVTLMGKYVELSDEQVLLAALDYASTNDFYDVHKTINFITGEKLLIESPQQEMAV